VSGSIGVAILGCGRMGERHAESVGRSTGFRLAAVADVDADAARALAARTGVPVHDGVEALAARGDVELVVVATPTSEHAAAAAAALTAGKHVLCEKPLARTMAEVAALCAAAERAGCLLAVGYTYRHAPVFRRLREVLDDGVIGRPHLAVVRAGGRGGHRAWKHSRAGGGGAVLEMMSHMIDLVLWLFGPPADARMLSCATLRAQRPTADGVVRADAEDYAVAELRWDGLRCLIEADLVSPGFVQSLDVQGGNGSAVAGLAADTPARVFLEQARARWRAGWSTLDGAGAPARDELWRALGADLHAGAFAHWRTAARGVAAVLEQLRSAA
jgi:predicted dehydrogenase